MARPTRTGPGHYQQTNTIMIMTTKIILAAAVTIFLSSTAFAEEGGTGHYMPGFMADFADSVPLHETFIARYNFLYYDGSVGANVPLPIGGLATAGANATSWASGLTLLWRPPVDLGDHWSYALSTTVPYVWVDVSANVTAGPRKGNLSSSVNGLGDMVL